MSNFLKRIWIVFVLMSWGNPHTIFGDDTFLYLLYDGTRAGEKNQVLGIANSLKKLLPMNTIQKEFDLKDQAAFILDVQKNIPEKSLNAGFIIAAEVSSIGVLKNLKPQVNIVITHSSHQFSSDHSVLKDVADIVALPQYVVRPEVAKAIASPYTLLVQTAGVPHNLSLEVIEEAYQSNKDLIPSAPTYMGIILGGDAETPDKKLRYYIVEEAIQMAVYMASQVREKNAHLLILNGPRTGKHDQQTGKVIEISHRDGNLDIVTGAFVKELQKQGLIQKKDFTLFDFQFGKPSIYPIVLGTLLKTKSPIFVAGESTSMVSETADCLSEGLVTAYTNNAMNENHRNHCASEREAGRINLLENKTGKWEFLKARETGDLAGKRPASEIIAHSIIKRFEEKKRQKIDVSAAK